MGLVLLKDLTIFTCGYRLNVASEPGLPWGSSRIGPYSNPPGIKKHHSEVKVSPTVHLNLVKETSTIPTGGLSIVCSQYEREGIFCKMWS